MSSWRSRWLGPLVAGADAPRRTAAAFALGVFLSFSPFFGLQIATGLAAAFALRLSRAAVLIGLCTNLPWIMVPWYTLTTVAGARMLGSGLPADVAGRLDELFGLRVYRAEFWERGAHLVAPFVWAFVAGSTLGAVVAGALAYIVAARFLARIQASRIAT